ncbi:MAG: LysR substrate-binding domain-containing protein [Terracidiphilus sp.]|nr:LysR substrate-binding domain-containing protein [Terracidiphilus sp.]
MAPLENFRLVVFRSVALHLSFRKASEELYLTQPAVSAQIKALEEELGVQLFDRSRGSVSLTEAGVVLLEYAHRFHALGIEAESKLGELKGEFSGELVLGASTTIAQYALPRRLGEFRRMNPRVEIQMTSGNTEEIVAALLEHRIALGLVEGPPRSRDVRVEPYLADELLLIVPHGHEWAERGSIGCEDLKAMPLLMRERGSGTRHVVELALERRGVRMSDLRIAMELDSTEAIKSAVEAGLGAGFVSRWALAQDCRNGKAFQIVAIEGVQIPRPFLLASVLGQEVQGVAAEFRRFLLADQPA